MKISKEIFKNDRKLVALAKKDRKAFSLLYEKYFDRIYLFIFKRVQDEAIAGDICQEAMLKAMLNIHKYEDRGFPFSAWLYRIASNETNMFFRKSKKMITVEVQEKHVMALMQEIKINESSTVDETEKLMEKISALKPEESEILDLRFFMQYSFKDIADFYGITEPNAKMRVYRLLDRIKKGWNKK